jgi:hypothetical protein
MRGIRAVLSDYRPLFSLHKKDKEGRQFSEDEIEEAS